LEVLQEIENKKNEALNKKSPRFKLKPYVGKEKIKQDIN